MITMTRTIGLMATLVLWLAVSATAGQWHIAGSLPCNDCHVGHGTEGGQEIPGGPFSALLKKNTVNELCLSCHDGTDPTAPDVLSPTPMYSSSPAKESSAGFFLSVLTMNAGGHDLGLPAATPLQAAGVTMELQCSNCHAVHGNANYRNLLEDPAGAGSALEVLLGRDVFTARDPDNPPTASGSAGAYDRSNVAYAANYSAWCASCHDLVRFNTQSAPPAHFNGHPSDIAINQALPDSHTDATHWRMGTGAGFVDGGDAAGIPRLPFVNSQGTDFTTAATPLESNHVFCLSCHKAHGGPNTNAMHWPYVEGGSSFISGCQQCHNK
ncbi:MAG: cytochrome c3 family protein [Candidatus Zixiibacteriota bacterium]